MAITKIEQSVMLERFREIEADMLEGHTYLYEPHSAAVVSAYLMGRGYQVLNVPEDDKIVVGIVPTSKMVH